MGRRADPALQAAFGRTACAEQSVIQGRARKLAASVAHWITDPRRPERPVGWVETEASEYVRPVRQIAVRCRRPDDEWGVGVLVSALTPETVLAWLAPPRERLRPDDAVALPASSLLSNFGDNPPVGQRSRRPAVMARNLEKASNRMPAVLLGCSCSRVR